MSDQIDFLTNPSENRLRKEVINILDSYSHPWDIIAELVQNSVDSIRRFNKSHPATTKKFRIEMVIDSKSKSIQIQDNGTGFPVEKLKDLLALNGTDKDDEEDEVGEKGVGLKYAIFSCNRFTLDSVCENGAVKGRVESAQSWVETGKGHLPKFIVDNRDKSDHEPEKTYTLIKLESIKTASSNTDDFFEMNTNALACVLRTKTAIGDVKALFGTEDIKVEVKVKHKSLEGRTNDLSVPFRYMTPTELIKPKGLLNLDDFLKKAPTMEDKQKKAVLNGKTLVMEGTIRRNGRVIRYYGCFVPKRSIWRDLTNLIEPIVEAEADDSDDEMPNMLIGPGIFLATKGMPAGIDLVPPKSGNAGYWPNTFILLEDDTLRFDLGRKSVPGRTQAMLKEIAKGIFNDLAKWGPLIGGEPPMRRGPTSFVEKEKMKEFADLRGLSELGLEGINFKKNPTGQEAGVVAIFHQLVGAGVLPDYFTLKQGYKEQYDLWGYYRIDSEHIGEEAWEACGERLKEGTELDIIIEFKHKAEDVIEDANENTKFFEDIDLIVCWDLDETVFSDNSIDVEVIRPEDAFYHGSNYRLHWPGTANLGSAGKKDVIALRKLIQDLLTSQ